MKQESLNVGSGLVFTRSSIRLAPIAPPCISPPDPRQAIERPRKRLSGPPSELAERLFPFHKHWPNESWEDNWSLYWLPTTFANRKETAAEARFARLLEALLRKLADEVVAREVTYFDSQLTYPYLTEHFVMHGVDYLPLQIMGFVPGKPPTRLPRYDDAQNIDGDAAFAVMKEKGQAFRPTDVFPHMPKLYYYIMGDQELARQNLMGRGGYTLFVTQRSQEDFTAVSKQLMAENSSDPIMDFVPMVAPLFDSGSFMTARIEQLKTYFGLFDLYVAECPADKGILIAASHDLDETLAELVKTCGYRAPKESGKKWKFWRENADDHR